MPQGAEAILRRVETTDAVRAAAFDAVYDATDAQDLQRRLQALPLPKAVKADLWDTRFGGEAPAPRGSAVDVARDVVTGVAKGAANTFVGLGELMHRMPGVTQAVDALYGREGLSDRAFPEARAAVRPANAAQAVGFYGEQIAENLIPVAGATRAARYLGEVSKSGGLAAAQSGSGRDATIAAGVSAVLPGGDAVRRVGQWVGAQAEPLVRAAIKPTVASLRRITGPRGLDAKANSLVRFIIDNRLTTAEKARDLFVQTEHELQRVLGVRNAPTDAATRAGRYLEALERSASRQGLPAEDVAQINQAAAQLLEGPMGRDVLTMVPTPHPTLLGPNGRPITVMRPQTTRALRPDVPADEALRSARSSGQWSTRRTWGEQRGASTEATKAVERAQRDAVKEAVPEARPLLQTEGKAIQAEEVLDRMAQRAGNRDAASLPAHVIAAGEIASGRVPVLAFAANWLRNNYMKAGIWADSLSRAIDAGNAPLAADILKRLGVGSVSQLTREPARAR